jgi:hypothetical protein
MAKTKFTHIKIVDTMQRHPYSARLKVQEDEERMKRIELREMKENVWKRRGSKKESCKKVKRTEERYLEELDDKLLRIDELLINAERETKLRLEKVRRKRDKMKRKEQSLTILI